jgi:hypothetical protein
LLCIIRDTYVLRPFQPALSAPSDWSNQNQRFQGSSTKKSPSDDVHFATRALKVTVEADIFIDPPPVMQIQYRKSQAMLSSIEARNTLNTVEAPQLTVAKADKSAACKDVYLQTHLAQSLCPETRSKYSRRGPTGYPQ